MRVLLMSQSYPPRLGGLETVVEVLAVQLRARGHEVRVITNRFPRHLPKKEVLEQIEVERILFLSPRWEQLRRKRPDLWLAGLVHSPLAGMRLRRLLREFRPDVINVHFPDVMIPFVRRLRRASSFRLVVSLHGHEINRFTHAQEGPVVGSKEALCEILREADAVTACSSWLLEQAAGIEPSVRAKGMAIPNGIDPGRFEDRTAYRHARPYVFAMGRLTWRKGFDLLIRAWARVAATAPDVDLILAGDGEDRPALESLSQELGVGKRVHFFGRANATEILHLLNGCLFLTAPSRQEAFGIGALEGLAAGKPVLATSVGGMGVFLSEVRERLSPRGGEVGPGGFEAPAVVLVEPTEEGIADGLRTRLTSGASGGEQARQMVRGEFSWARVAERYERAFAGG